MTDFYELTMGQGYFSSGTHTDIATFELFYRSNPFDGGYAIACGMYDVVKFLSNFRFDSSDIAYLQSLDMFEEDYLEYLSQIQFRGSIEGVKEGTIVFPYEPILQVSGELCILQLIESALLNIVNYQTLIATKSARIAYATRRKNSVLEFGLRRAQGLGAMVGARAAIIGGCSATSNTLAGKLYDLPVAGTQAHSWIQSFENELDAFRVYAQTFPNNTVLLVDTYDTLESGVPNAIKIAKEMESRNQSLRGIRIDSGDLAWLAIKSAKMLDQAGLEGVKIVLSSDLNEFIIESIVNQISSHLTEENNGEFSTRLLDRLLWGVGTHLITGSGGEKAALGGVYKLVEKSGRPVIKISENRAKTTNPGKKVLWRLKSNSGKWIADVMGLVGEDPPISGDLIYHHADPTKFLGLDENQASKLHVDLLEYYTNGRSEKDIWQESKQIAEQQLSELDPTHKRFLNPHSYKVSLSAKLNKLKQDYLSNYGV
jgi:nicotinate phosphoribosyltransferase